MKDHRDTVPGNLYIEFNSVSLVHRRPEGCHGVFRSITRVVEETSVSVEMVFESGVVRPVEYARHNQKEIENNNTDYGDTEDSEKIHDSMAPLIVDVETLQNTLLVIRFVVPVFHENHC